MPDSKDVLAALAIVALVAFVPWLATLWPSLSLFGFPWPAFVPLLAAPVLLIMAVRSARHEDVSGDGDGS